MTRWSPMTESIDGLMYKLKFLGVEGDLYNILKNIY